MARYLGEPKSLPRGTRHLFVAEGQAEVGLLVRMLRSLSPGDEAVIVCAKGVERIGSLIKRLVQPPIAGDLVSVTVIADADADPGARLDQIWNAFAIADSARASGKAEGSAVDGSTRYAVWLSPGSGRCGRIEDLVLETLDKKTRACIAELWRCAAAARDAERPSAKAEVAVWAALRHDEGVGLKTAFERGTVDVGHSAFEPLRERVRAQLAHKGGTPG